MHCAPVLLLSAKLALGWEGDIDMHLFATADACQLLDTLFTEVDLLDNAAMRGEFVSVDVAKWSGPFLVSIRKCRSEIFTRDMMVKFLE